MYTMKLPYILTLLGLSLFSLGCNQADREKKLEEREALLLQKEKAFADKDSDYNALIKMRDSLQLAEADTSSKMDTTHWAANIIGDWNSKVVCVSSSCGDYVIGDQKNTDLWRFGNDSTSAYTQLLNNNKLIRTYKGTENNGKIDLAFQTDSTASKDVHMLVSLSFAGSNMLKGYQTITIDNSCTATFTVELTKNN